MHRNDYVNVCHSIVLTVFLILFALNTGIVVAKQDRQLVVFGDSLSDPGNAFVLTGMQSLAPYDLIPDAPYAIGGHHFSNGKTWVERFANKQGSHSRPAFRYNGGTNYAVGGSRARSVGQVNLTTQVGLYLSQFGSVVYRDDLFVLFIGGNDIRDAVEAFALDQTGTTSARIISEALTAVQDNLALLMNSGARHFLIVNAPDLALVPAVRQQGMPAQQVANFFSVSFNQGLEQILDGLQTSYPVTVTRLDVFALLHEVVANPENFDIEEAVLPCITPGVIVGAVCKHQNEYLFWDGIHPTRKGHKIISRQALSLFDGDKSGKYKHKPHQTSAEHVHYRKLRGSHW